MSLNPNVTELRSSLTGRQHVMAGRKSHLDSEGYDNIPCEENPTELVMRMRTVHEELKEGKRSQRTQRKLLMVLVTLLVLVFMFLIILIGLVHLYYSRITEATLSIKQDIPKEIRQCDSGWKKFDGNCYYIVTTMKNWTEARAICKSMNSDLVVINSEREQKFLESLTVESEFWIGLRRDKKGMDEWRWVDGTLQNPSAGFWMEGEPNNEFGYEDCVHMWRDKKWNDKVCTFLQKAFCEK
ncbi:hepatic lectin-like [Xenopus tropicalis]|uniref:Hepatic lectin-like n=1 Tax=Xenopus tropicalis TaxID=8364 RepID=A0A8J1JBF3_XENTR|nr:hepatic lectin-like [Xenopus tropicalis]